MNIPYSTHCLSHPKALALDLQQVKKFLKIDNCDEDILLTSLIKSVSMQCQNYTGYALITQKWQATFDRYVKKYVKLNHKPVRSVDKIFLINSRDKKVEFSPSFYSVSQELSRVEFYVFPMSQKIRIEYTCGFGDSSEHVPEELQTILLRHVSFLYENRAGGKDFDMSAYNAFRAIRF
jgi:uncharacterized phiE125 gp8 family phage protein